MKEWRTTVADYIRELKDIHGNWRKNGCFIVLLLIVFVLVTGILSVITSEITDRITEYKREKLIAEYTVLYEEMQDCYLDMREFMEKQDYGSAFSAALLTFEAELRIVEWRDTVWRNAGNRVARDGGYDAVNKDEVLVQMLFDDWQMLLWELCDLGRHKDIIEWMRNSTFVEITNRYNHRALWEEDALFEELQSIFIRHSEELMKKGEYREAAEILLESFYLFLEETEYEYPAELYAEELRAAGDDAGAEEWEEYVRSRYRGIMAKKWDM